MLISTINIRNKALKQYFEQGDNLASYSDDEGGHYAPELDLDLTEEDLQYAGGSAEDRKSQRPKKKEKRQAGCCEKIFGNGILNRSAERPDLTTMTEEQRKAHARELWAKARRYTNRLRFQARLQRMAESNLKEMMIDDIAEEGNGESMQVETGSNN